MKKHKKMQEEEKPKNISMLTPITNLTSMNVKLI